MALAPNDDDSQTIRTLSLSMAGDIVELVVLTADDMLLQTMRDAVGGSRRLWHVLSADKVSDLLVAGEVGIVLIDVAALHESAAVFVSEIKRQFPDLVVLVAGGRDSELDLAPQISAGTVYRFIHKPLSPNRARLFVEAAVRRYGEHRRSFLAPPPAQRREGVNAWPLIALGGAALLGLIVVLALSLRSSPPPEPVVTAGRQSASSPALAQILNRAATALAANRLTAPAGDNALELYLQASALAPADATARAGLAEVRERLLARAENALLEERLDEAAAAIETARRSGVETNRVAFLSAQLAKSREQLRTQKTRTRSSAPPGLATAPVTAPVTAAVPPSPRTAAAATAEKSVSLAGLAVERVAQGKLVEPADDNARFYVLEGLKADPTSEPVNEARKTLAARLLIEARTAMDRRDFTRAADWLQNADGIALPENIEATRSLLGGARQQAQTDGLAQMMKNGTDRLSEDRLIEPASDSAKFYLMALRGLDPQHAGLPAALNELGARLVAKARLAFTLKQYAAARSWLDEATAVGYSSPDAMSIGRDLEQLAERQKQTTDVVPANQLTLLKSVQPLYPASAQAGSEGWVEVDFTVAPSGAVSDPTVHAASTPGVFDDAALRAVGQWHYQPVERDGQTVAVRSRVRIRFTP